MDEFDRNLFKEQILKVRNPLAVSIQVAEESRRITFSPCRRRTRIRRSVQWIVEIIFMICFVIGGKESLTRGKELYGGKGKAGRSAGKESYTW